MLSSIVGGGAIGFRSSSSTVLARASENFLERIFGCAGVVETPLTTPNESSILVARIFSDVDYGADKIERTNHAPIKNKS